MNAWTFWNGPELGDVEGVLVGKFQLDPGLDMWTEMWSEISSWIPAGASGRTFAWREWKGISLGSSDGDMVAKWKGELIGEVNGYSLGVKRQKR